MSGVTTQNLARFYDNLAMVMAMEPKTLIVHGLEVAVERNEAGIDINTAASSWVTKGYLTQADADDFDRIIRKYKENSLVEFLHKPLIGVEWQKGLASVDVLAIPYGNERYLYHTSALISNAMGYRKPVVMADNVNPEILAKYDIGKSFRNGEMDDFTASLDDFVNHYDELKSIYQEQLELAYNDYSPRKLAENIVALAEKA